MSLMNRVRKFMAGGERTKGVAASFSAAKETYAEQLAKASYAAARPSKYRRTRHQLGGTADAHYASETEFYRLREYARDMDRNDAIVGQMVDRAVDNILRTGLTLEPDTGDEALNAEIKAAWNVWSSDPESCDVGGRLSFYEMERLALRHTIIDGDVFALLPTDTGGKLQLLEGDRVTSPTSFADGIVQGVELDEQAKPVRYWISKQPVSTREFIGRRLPQDYDKRDARDADGNPNVLHIYNPKRITQTRGITAFAPIFDLMGMVEDTNFAKLVQQQVVSCIGAFITRDSDHQWGARSEEAVDGFTQQFEELVPGLVARLRPGEDIKAFSPNVPNSEWFEHLRSLLRMIGANVGMPLFLVLLDSSNTTFHGYRGELQQARMGFECIQRWLPMRFHRHVYRWWMRIFYPGVALKHTWRAPGWPYVDPEKDAKADILALENMLTSPRQLHAKRGSDWDTVVRETIEDRTLAVLAAVKASQLIEGETGEKINWRELLNLAPPTGLSVSAQLPIDRPDRDDEPSEEDSDE